MGKEHQVNCTIICDSCGKEMHVQSFAEKTIEIKSIGVVDVAVFSCPNCDKEYLAFALDRKTRAYMEKVQKIDAQFKSLKRMKAGQEREDLARSLLKERDSVKRSMHNHNNRVKMMCLKEMVRHG